MRIAYVVADGGVPVTGHNGISVHVREMVRAPAAKHAGGDVPTWQEIARQSVGPVSSASHVRTVP